MEKINFINNSQPALNATNLNKLQDNVEDAFKTVKTTSDTDTYSCNYINNMDKYSTNEVKTNKVWIDGKPIYRKVIQSTLANNDVGMAGIYIIEIHGFVKSTYNQWWPLPNIYSNSDYNIYLYLTAYRNEFVIEYNSYYTTSSPYEIVIEYIKTTD